MYDESEVDYCRITVIATGLEQSARQTSSFSSMNRKSPFGGSSVSQGYSAPKFTAPQATPVQMPNLTLPEATAPTSTVQKRDIQIPDFLKNRK